MNERCHDCGIENKHGHFHHFGCDMERCPKCDGQLLSCGHIMQPVNGDLLASKLTDAIYQLQEVLEDSFMAYFGLPDTHEGKNKAKELAAGAVVGFYSIAHALKDK